MNKRNTASSDSTVNWVNNHHWELLLVFILIISFCLVMVNLTNSGASYDEPSLYEYSDRMVDAYKKMAFGESIESLFDFYIMAYYGAAYLILGRVPLALIGMFAPGLDTYNAWHLVNFATFLLSSWLIFRLTRRIASKPAAFFAAVLYLTQPLLWGHGVMNPKDVPFMAAFIATIVTGLKMVDLFDQSATGLARDTRAGFIHWSKTKKIAMLILVIIAVILLVDRIGANILFKGVVHSGLTKVFNVPAGHWMYPILTMIIPNSTAAPIATYLSKAIRLLNLVELIVIIGISLTCGIFVWRKSSPKAKALILAGIVSGLTVATRVIGPAAAGLVTFYAFMKNSKQRWQLSVGYVAVNMVVTYFAWPFLWGNPIFKFFDSLRVMVAFPWDGTVRFEGSNFLAGDLPFYYLPKLISIQFTVPLLVLALTGTYLLIKKGVKQEPKWDTGIIMLIWFWAPLFIVMALQPNSYDNFRQFLFIIPPLFVMAGVAIDAIGRLVRQPGLRAILVGAGLLPGIIAGVWLHPYEYVYYNALVGWTASVERRYETDYWGTSMCEAGRFVSDQTSQLSVVVLNDEILRRLFERCSTQTLDIRLDPGETLGITPEFAVFLSRFDHDQNYYRDLGSLLAIQRGKTIFAVVKGIP